MSYSGFGTDSMPYYQFVTAGDGSRSFSDAARQAVLSMLGNMYVAPQVPAVDSDGTRVLLTPGGSLGLPTGYASAVGAARAGQIVLALESFVPTIQQALRFTTADRVADLTADGGQGYVVLLTPETAQSLSPFEAPPTMPALPPAPPAPLPTPGTTPDPNTPHPLPGPAPTLESGMPVVVYGAPFPTTTMLVAGAAVLGVVAIVAMSGKKQPAKAKYRSNQRPINAAKIKSALAMIHRDEKETGTSEAFRYAARIVDLSREEQGVLRRALHLSHPHVATRPSRFRANMTKKDYVVAAASIAKLPKARRRQMAEDLAKMFQSDNPRFDRQRFFAACGV